MTIDFSQCFSGPKPKLKNLEEKKNTILSENDGIVHAGLLFPFVCFVCFDLSPGFPDLWLGG